MHSQNATRDKLCHGNTYDFVRGFIRVQVYTADIHRCVCGWCGDDDFLSATSQVGRCSVVEI